jgi:dTDP-4-amino-4,6-dideoxygalactose transaminase
MLARARLDVSWSNLFITALSMVAPGRRAHLTRRIERLCSPADDAVVCLSVRSGFDLLLEALALPPGSEVLLSAVTIADMTRIVRAHGLVPVPVDIDPQTLEPDPDSLRSAVTSKSRVFVVAHLFGAVVPLDASMQLAREHGLVFVEDCAQAYAPGVYRGDERADVRMFSFGPIKTDTAMGGAVLQVRDEAVRSRMRSQQQQQQLQPRADFAKRLLKYALLHLVATPVLFPLFVLACRWFASGHDAVIRRAARGYPSALFRRIRRRPSHPQLALLARRLTHPNEARLKRRARAGEALGAALGEQVRRPGAAARVHTHWTFPILCEQPDALMRHLWTQGFDATRGEGSLTVVDTPDERPQARAPRAAALMDEILFVPAYPEMPERSRQRLAEVLLTQPVAAQTRALAVPTTAGAATRATVNKAAR